MSNSVLSFINEGIADLHPYEPGRSIDEVIAEYNPEKVVKLASNENPLGPSPKAKEALSSSIESLHLYPDGDAKDLKLKIAKLESVSKDQIIIGNGSNEILELAGRAFLNNKSSALMSKHAFAVYKIVTQACGAKALEVPMIDWRHDLKSFNNYIEEDTKVIFAYALDAIANIIVLKKAAFNNLNIFTLFNWLIIRISRRLKHIEKVL